MLIAVEFGWAWRVILSRADGEGPHNCSKITQTSNRHVSMIRGARSDSWVGFPASVRSLGALRQPRDDTRLGIIHDRPGPSPHYAGRATSSLFIEC